MANKFYSFIDGGHLILHKAALFALPVYFLSLFKALTDIISHLESLFKSFLWDKVCPAQEKEGWVLGGCVS